MSNKFIINFILGIVFSQGILMVQHGYMGTENFIEHVRQHWIVVEPWWIGLIIIAITIGWCVKMVIEEDKK